jgi:membrane-bound serine protease (ClpP class)
LSLQTFVIPTNDKEMNIFMDNLFIATLGIGTDIFALFLLSRFLPDAPLGKITVETVQTAQDGYTTVMPGLDKLTGKQGLVLSTLRPAGRAEIEGQSYDVITQGDFIEKGEKIVVVMVEGNRVIVEKTGV